MDPPLVCTVHLFTFHLDFWRFQCIIDRVDKGDHLFSLLLMHWKSRVGELLSTFDSVHFHHIYKEQNVIADRLSRRSLGIMNILLLCEEYIRGNSTQLPPNEVLLILSFFYVAEI